MAPRGGGPGVRRRAACSISGRRAVILASSSSTPMTPVEATITSRWRQSKPLADRGGDPAHRVGARPAGEGVGAAGVDHQRADVLALGGLQMPLAPVDRRGAHAVAGEHAGAAGAFGEASSPAGRRARACRSRPGRSPSSTPAIGGMAGTARPAARRASRHCAGLGGGGAAARRRRLACLSARFRAARLRALASGSRARSTAWPTASAGLTASLLAALCGRARAFGGRIGRRRRGGRGARAGERRPGAGAARAARRRAGHSVGCSTSISTLALAAQLLQQVADLVVGQEAHDLRPRRLQR